MRTLTSFLNPFIVATWMALLSVAASAAQPVRNAEVFTQIAKFAHDFCQVAPVKGTRGDFRLTGKAIVKLKAFLKKLVTFELAGEADVKMSKYEGVIQNDLAALLQHVLNCRLVIWGDLKSLIVPYVKTEAETAQSTDEKLYILLDAAHRLCRDTVFQDSVRIYVQGPNPHVGAVGAATQGDRALLTSSNRSDSVSLLSGVTFTPPKCKAVNRSVSRECRAKALFGNKVTLLLGYEDRLPFWLCGQHFEFAVLDIGNLEQWYRDNGQNPGRGYDYGYLQFGLYRKGQLVWPD